MPLRKPFVVVVPLVLLAAICVAPPAGSTSSAGDAASAASFTDAAGDSGVAPDITSVHVGNDVDADPIVFWVTLPNRLDKLVGDDAIVISLNTDRDAATGDEGTDHAIGVDADGADLIRWDGAMYVPADATARATTESPEVVPGRRLDGEAGRGSAAEVVRMNPDAHGLVGLRESRAQ